MAQVAVTEQIPDQAPHYIVTLRDDAGDQTTIQASDDSSGLRLNDDAIVAMGNAWKSTMETAHPTRTFTLLMSKQETTGSSLP